MTMVSNLAVVGSAAPEAIEQQLLTVPAECRPFARLILAHLPLNGMMRGNIALRKATRTVTNGDYSGAKQALLQAGLIRVGKGNGGSIGLAQPFISDGAPGSIAPRGGLELQLYKEVAERLPSRYEQTQRFDKEPVIEITAVQGRKNTGGKWTRPDITVVLRHQFSVLAGAHLEVHTYEVKPAGKFSVDAIHEARAQRRCAHRSFVVVDLEHSAQASVVRNQAEAARDLGVGLLSFFAVEDEWDVVVDAPFNRPGPIDLDGFLDAQLREQNKQRIREWSAFPAASAS